MWKRLICSKYYMLYSGSYVIMITDFVNIWYTTYSELSFIDCLKESNPGLEMNEKELMQKGLKLLTHPEDLKDIRVVEDKKQLNVTLSMSFGYPFKLRMIFAEGSKEMYAQKITLQLLTIIQDLRRSEQELIHLLQKKDKEIEEYKCEGGEIALRHLKTVPFNDEQHTAKHTTYCDNFGSTDLPDILLKNTATLSDIPAMEITTIQIKEDPRKKQRDVKSEPGSEESELYSKKREIKSDPGSDKSDSHGVKSELQTIKIESNSIKIESDSQSQTRLTIHRPGVSPSKTKKKKFNW